LSLRVGPPTHVRFWHKADMTEDGTNVRFRGKADIGGRASMSAMTQSGRGNSNNITK
jgi:hypothetical protein